MNRLALLVWLVAAAIGWLRRPVEPDFEFSYFCPDAANLPEAGTIFAALYEDD